MTRATDTKARIQAVARELFVAKGIQQTSLREIADRLGISKPALYHHFASRDALVVSIVEPLLADMDAFIAAREGAGRPEARALLADYFDLLLRHRDTITMLVRDLSTLGNLDFAGRMIAWRQRLIALLLGPRPSLAARVRAVVAIGGMSDCTVEFAGVSLEKIKPIALAAACAALERDG